MLLSVPILDEPIIGCAKLKTYRCFTNFFSFWPVTQLCHKIAHIFLFQRRAYDELAVVWHQFAAIEVSLRKPLHADRRSTRELIFASVLQLLSVQSLVINADVRISRASENVGIGASTTHNIEFVRESPPDVIDSLFWYSKVELHGSQSTQQNKKERAVRRAQVISSILEFLSLNMCFVCFILYVWSYKSDHCLSVAP